MAADTGIMRMNLTGMAPADRAKLRAFCVDLFEKIEAKAHAVRTDREVDSLVRCQEMIFLIDEVDAAGSPGETED